MFNNKKNLSGMNSIYGDYIYENKGDLQQQIDNIQYNTISGYLNILNNYITNNNTVNEYISIYTNDISSNLNNYTINVDNYIYNNNINLNYLNLYSQTLSGNIYQII